MADDATFRARYLSKVAADLKSIELERGRIRTQIEELHQQLAELDHDYGALVDVQQTLSEQQEMSSPVRGGQGSSEAGGGVLLPAAGRQTLRDLVQEYLGSLQEPAAAADVANTLARRYPQRSVQIPVVRNTLEGLVAKGLAVRSKQDRLVFYRAVTPEGSAGQVG